MFCALGGIAIGMAFDQVLWAWSYDYVYPLHFCRERGLRLGVWLGTIVAAATVWGNQPVPPLRWVSCSFVLALLVAVIGACGFAGTAWAWAKFSGNLGDGHTERPLSRLAFCSELVRGGGYCACVSALIWAGIVWRFRRKLSMDDQPQG